MEVNIVRKVRRWKDMTQADLAAAVGVTRQTIVNIEKGNYSPSVYVALDLADALGMSVEELFRPTDPDTPPVS